MEDLHGKIYRQIQDDILKALDRQAVVAIIGPRQVGKTTLAFEIRKLFKDSIYLDLESYVDRQKLSDPSLFLSQYQDTLVVLDEIHRVPELFQVLRGLVDEGRRNGRKTGRFLLLGSASIDLLHQSGESLAGRIEYVNMNPLNILELGNESKTLNQLWVRGGFPDIYLAKSDADSLKLRLDFIHTYLERDISAFGSKIPAQTLERFWSMLGYEQGSLLNASKMATNLMISSQTVARYLDLLVDLLLVRRLTSYLQNPSKRLVKSPKVYIRDSGLLHALLNISDFNQLLGHSIVGASWEGFVIENLLNVVPDRTISSFYRSTQGAEIDLLLELPNQEKWAIEIKRGLSPNLQKGFYIACEDIKPDRKIVIYSGDTAYPLTRDVEAMPLYSLVEELKRL